MSETGGGALRTRTEPQVGREAVIPAAQAGPGPLQPSLVGRMGREVSDRGADLRLASRAVAFASDPCFQGLRDTC